MKVEPQQFRSFLLDAGLVTDKQFSKARKRAEKTNSVSGKN